MGQPFHHGELAAQHRLGVQPAGGNIRDFVNAQHVQFFAELPFVVVGTHEADWPMATLLVGAPGFVSVFDQHRIKVACTLDGADMTQRAIGLGKSIALLGIDLATRRRNRANGTVLLVDSTGFELTVEQSFGNCPQYIHQRWVTAVLRAASETEELGSLDPAARTQIANADTFFVASSGGVNGVDVSHRGGPPGFVELGHDTLTIPDYSGNRYFNTFGNFMLNPRAGLLFVDFVSGDLLHLQGVTDIVWEAVQRHWHLRVERVWRRRSAVALQQHLSNRVVAIAIEVKSVGAQIVSNDSVGSE